MRPQTFAALGVLRGVSVITVLDLRRQNALSHSLGPDEFVNRANVRVFGDLDLKAVRSDGGRSLRRSMPSSACLSGGSRARRLDP